MISTEAIGLTLIIAGVAILAPANREGDRWRFDVPAEKTQERVG